MHKVVIYKRLKKIINRQPQKVVAVTYRRWSFTRGFNCKALTEKILVFWIGGNLWEVVAYKRWSHMEGPLYMYFSDTLTLFVIHLYFYILYLKLTMTLDYSCYACYLFQCVNIL